MKSLLIPAALLVLAACGQSGDGGTSISIAGNDQTGATRGATMDGKTGEVKVDLPGFSGQFKLPKIQLDADNFDLNGVKLYPGSTIAGVNVDADGKSKEDGAVQVSFDSPASAETVRGWFAERLNKAGFDVAADAQGLSGRTDENKPFRMTLTPNGADKAHGVIHIG